MAQEPGGAQGTSPTQQSPANGGGEPQGQPQGGQPTPAGEGATSSTPKTPGQTPITSEILSGVVGRINKSIDERVGKMAEEQKALVASLTAKLDELANAGRQSPSKGEGGKAVSGDQAAAIMDLEKRHKDLEAKLQLAERRAQEAEAAQRDYKFKSKVIDSLNRNQCVDSETAWLALKHHHQMNFDPESEKVTVKVKDTQYGLGEVEVPLDDFIKNTFAEDVLPYLFRGKIRPGAPAGGDAGGGAENGKFAFKRSDLERMPMEDYMKNREKIEEARLAGRIALDQ